MAHICECPNGKWRAQVYRRGRRSSRTFGVEQAARKWAAREECRVEGMPSLREAIEDHQIADVLPKRFLSATKIANYTESEIVEAATPIHDIGIYFLVRLGQVMYVGQTTNLQYRLYRHRKNGRRFDSVAFIPCRRDQLDEIEEAYITLIIPPWNSQLSAHHVERA